MNFNFYPIESRIFDFLVFPSLISEKERYEKSKEEDGFKVPYFSDYLDLLNRVEVQLEPYIKDINIYYMNNLHREYDFIDMISSLYMIFGHKSEGEYLDMLLGLDDKDIIKSIAYSIISDNENSVNYSEELMNRAKALSLNKSELISLIKDLPTEASSKWNLFLIIEEPVKYMKMYVDLMYKVLPIFTDFYKSYEEEVGRYGQYLAEFLNENGAKGLEEKTYSILDSKILNDEENRILISSVLQYGIFITGAGQYSYMSWGLKMDEAFKIMKEANENKINERVQVFKNLGDKTRYEVVRLIASGQTSTKEIAQALGVSSATISYHLNNLLQAKIIKIDRTDNRYGYVVDHELLELICNELMKDLNNLKN